MNPSGPDSAPTPEPSTIDLADPNWPDNLVEAHRKYLADRGVAPDIAKSRGYFTAMSRSQLPEGFSHNPKNIVTARVNGQTGKYALVLPLYSIGAEEPTLYQLRLDDPRPNSKKPGKHVKFEIPGGTKRGVEPGSLPADVHPSMHFNAAETDAPFVFTEGLCKADALLTAARAENIDIVPVAFTGVTMPYQKADSPDAKPMLADSLTDMPWAGRTVFLCWDADWRTNKMVADSLAITADLLSDAGADVQIIDVPPVNGDEHTGVDDYLAANGRGGGTLAKLLADHIGEPPSVNYAKMMSRPDTFLVDEANAQMMYTDKDGDAHVAWGVIGRVREKRLRRTINEHKLEAMEDEILLELEWVDDTGTRRRRDMVVPSASYRDLKVWFSQISDVALAYQATISHWDTKVANTIANFEADKAIESVGTEATGWYLDLDDHEERSPWRYVHGGGWIGADDFGDDIRTTTAAEASKVTLSPRLDFERRSALKLFLDDWVRGLRVEKEYAALNNRAKAEGLPEVSRDVFDVHHALAFGTALICRSLVPGAPLRGAVYLTGEPSTGKTLTGKVWASSFGSWFADRPYASFKGTAAGVEVALGPARNILAVVDDFHPSDERQTERMASTMDGLVRGAHDGAVKQRSTAKLTSMAVPQPSATLVLTGEVLPTVTDASNSMLQRLLVMSMDRKAEPGTPESDVYAMLRSRIKDDKAMAPQQRFVSLLVSMLADRLNELTAEETTNDTGAADHKAVTSRVLTRLLEGDFDDSGTSSVDRVGSVTSRINALVELAQAESLAKNPDAVNARTTEIVRDLVSGFAVFLDLALRNDLLDESDVFDLEGHVAAAVGSVVANTVRVVSETDPGRRAFDVLKTLLNGHRAHFALESGESPTGEGVAISWGWSYRNGALEPSRNLIGWFVAERGSTPAHLALDTHLLRQALVDVRSSAAAMSEKALASALGNYSTTNGEALCPFRSRGDRYRVTRVVNGTDKQVLALDPAVLGVKMPPTTASAGNVTPIDKARKDDSAARAASGERNDADNEQSF